mgnify:CR=1 FL=1
MKTSVVRSQSVYDTRWIRFIQTPNGNLETISHAGEDYERAIKAAGVHVGGRLHEEGLQVARQLLEPRVDGREA